MRRLLLLLSLTAVVLAPVRARAQSLAVGAPGGAKTEGPGIGLGERLVLHLGIGAELRYDSNVFYESDNVTQGLALRVTPAFLLSTRVGPRAAGPDGAPPAPPKVEFRLGAGLDYREWIYANTGVRPPRQFNVQANFGLTILPAGPVTIDLYDTFVRSAQPAYTVVNYNLDRDMNELGIRLRIKPGGGRLELQLGYAFGIDLWEVSILDRYDNFYHRSNIRLLWKFLPKTSVYIQGENYVYQYRTPGGLSRPDGYPLRVIAGLNGLITAKLNFDLWAGYANGFYQNDAASPNTGIVGLTLGWRPLTLTQVQLAYRHDFINALLGVYADIDNVQLSLTQGIWRFVGFVRLAYQNTRYKGIVDAAGMPTANNGERTDNSFTLNARVDFFTYKSWMALSLGYDFNLLRSDSQANVIGPGGILGTVPVDFNKHEVYLSLSFLY